MNEYKRDLYKDNFIDTLILTHGDTDGVCSGAIAKCAYPNSHLYFTNPVGLLRKLDIIKGYKNIIICDIAIDERNSEVLLQKLKDIAQKYNLIYIDHHPGPAQSWNETWLYNDHASCSSELTYNTLISRLNNNMRRVAIYGAIGDYADDTPNIKEWYKSWDKRTLFFQGGALSQAIIFAGREFDFKRLLIEHLHKNKLPSSIPNVLEFAKKCSNIEEELQSKIRKEVKILDNFAYVIDPESYKSKSAIYAASIGNRKIGGSAEYRENKHVYDISFRSNSDVDLNIILRKIAKKFEGTGGGLPEAAGARIPADKFNNFLKELDRQIGEETIKLEISE